MWLHGAAAHTAAASVRRSDAPPVVVESRHPYVAPDVSHWQLQFPDAVTHLSIAFDVQCSTVQVWQCATLVPLASLASRRRVLFAWSRVCECRRRHDARVLLCGRGQVEDSVRLFADEACESVVGTESYWGTGAVWPRAPLFVQSNKLAVVFQVRAVCLLSRL
jgi:hypothetical protein